MEFFHAKIYWSGYGEILTNVIELPTSYGWNSTGIGRDYVILRVLLNKEEVLQLRSYLDSEFDRHISDVEFEKSMECVFYNGTPVDSWFNLEKFMQICCQLKINPTMFYYRYKRILTLNMK